MTQKGGSISATRPENITQEQWAAMSHLERKRALNAFIRVTGLKTQASPDRIDAVLHVGDAILRSQENSGEPEDWSTVQEGVEQQFTGPDEDYFLYAMLGVPESLDEDPDSND